MDFSLAMTNHKPISLTTKLAVYPNLKPLLFLMRIQESNSKSMVRPTYEEGPGKHKSFSSTCPVTSFMTLFAT